MQSKKSSRRNGILASPALSMPLAILMSSFFIWSANAASVNLETLAQAVMVMVALCLGFYSILGKIYRRYQRMPHTESNDRVLGALLVILTVQMIFIFMDIFITQQSFLWGVSPLLLNVLTMAAALLLVKFTGFKALNGLMALWLAIAVVTGVQNVVVNLPNPHKNTDIKAELKTKPNIYLFLMESFMNLDDLKELYGIDSAPLRSLIEENDFIIYEPVLSNSAYSLGSMADTLMMTLARAQQSNVNTDVATWARNALGGGQDNAVYRILKENGYKTVYLNTGIPYAYHTKGPYLDETDIAKSPTFVSFFVMLNINMFSSLAKYMIDYGPESKYHGSLMDRVIYAAEEGLKEERPFFICFEGGADHSPALGYVGTPEAIDRWRPRYHAAVVKAHCEIDTIIGRLIEMDPNSVIILLGDHGPMAYQGLFDKEFRDGDIEGFRRIMDQYNLTVDQVAKEYFSTLMAVRLPGGEKTDISDGMLMSHANLFRHIFAYLSDDKTLLDDRVPVESVHGQILMGRDHIPTLERKPRARN